MDIYVGSIPFKLKEEQLKELFEQYGEVASATIIVDKITRQNKGFAFVTMPDDEQATTAIEALNGSDLDGRTITVKKSEPKERDNSRGFNKNKNPYLHGGGGFGGKGGGGFKGNSKGFNSNRGFNRKSS